MLVAWVNFWISKVFVLSKHNHTIPERSNCYRLSLISTWTRAFFFFFNTICNWVFHVFFCGLFIYLFILFMAVLGLRFCVRAFSSCGKRGPLFIAVRGPLTIAASLVAEHRLQTHRLSNCGSRAKLLRGMWDLPRPGLEPVSPALAGGFSTTAPPGKPWTRAFNPICNLNMMFQDTAGQGTKGTDYHYCQVHLPLLAQN